MAGIIILAPVATIVRMWLLGILVGAICLDALHIMIQLQSHHDELQNYHQLLIEKNVSFACAVIGEIKTYQHRDLISIGQLPFDASLGAVRKGISTIYVKAKL